MAVTYGYFNSINGDRKYNADQMSDYFRGIVNEGVFQHLNGGLAVVAGTGMEVTVATGRAIVQNKWVQNDAAFPLTIEAASDTYGRKDAVVIRLSYTNRAISIVVKTGTPSASPAAPSLTRSSTTYEMALAYVNVSAGATSVTVTDKRSDTSVCGWATVAQETSGEVDQMLNAMKTGFDGVVYSSPAEAVQAEDRKISDELYGQRKVAVQNTLFFDFNNEFIKSKATFYNDRYVNSSGKIVADNSVGSLSFPAEANTTYYLHIPGADRKIIAESETNDFSIGLTKTTLSVTGTDPLSFTTGSTCRYIIIYFKASSYDYNANVDNIILNKNSYSATQTDPKLKPEYVPTISPKNTDFFVGVNYFNPDNATFYNDRYVNNSGTVTADSNVGTVVFPVEPNTNYYFSAPNMDRHSCAESDSDSFTIGSTKTYLTSTGTNPTSFTTGSTAKYVIIYFSSTTYDWNTYKDQIILNKNQYYGIEDPFIPAKYLDKNSVLEGKNILIFGDSITDCCNITINAQNQTTAYSFANPSNQYYDEHGDLIQYSMWPKILKLNQPVGEIRNYAHYGASYKTQQRESGKERQNVQYQIDVALNDRYNPNNAFSVDDFIPDIVIFALGINDGDPNDSYDSAMENTIYSGQGIIDVDATISALDESKTIESARKAYLRIKKEFPMAQIYSVLPIQTANTTTPYGNLHEYLKQIGNRYGCIIIDGAYNCGITREFNLTQLGYYLKDGLHPNEKGQNLMARMIITELLRNYIPFGIGFNS